MRLLTSLTKSWCKISFQIIWFPKNINNNKIQLLTRITYVFMHYMLYIALLQIVGIAPVCYLLLFNRGVLHCLNHVETKDYITSCIKPQRNYKFEAGHSINLSIVIIFNCIHTKPRYTRRFNIAKLSRLPSDITHLESFSVATARWRFCFVFSLFGNWGHWGHCMGKEQKGTKTN